jgi:hypothetical protein
MFAPRFVLSQTFHRHAPVDLVLVIDEAKLLAVRVAMQKLSVAVSSTCQGGVNVRRVMSNAAAPPSPPLSAPTDLRAV